MADQFDLWRTELATPLAPEDRQHRSTNPHEMGGYWRIESAKTKPDYPVAIWTGGDDKGNLHGVTIFQIGRMRRDTDSGAAEWQEFTEGSWLWCHAVTREEWATALESGFWPSDGKPARKMDADEKLGIAMPSGDNAPPLVESLADQIKAAAEEADKAKVTDQESANKATGILDRLRALLKKAEAARVEEKEPHLQASREVDARWAAVAAPGKDAGVALDDRRKAWLRAEQKRLDDEAAKERKRLADEAEARRIQAEHDAKAKGVEPPPPEPAPEPAPEPKRASAGTAFGRASGLKKVKVAKIVDLPMLVNALVFAGNGPDADALAYFQNRADKALRGGITLPGVTVTEEMR